MKAGDALADLTLSAMTMRGRPFGDRVEAAAGAGYTGIGLTAGDYRDALHAGWTDDAMRDRLRRHRLRVTEVESPWDWAGEEAADERERALLVHIARAFGIDQLSVVLFTGHDHGVLVERLTRLSRVMAAARDGRPVQVALEFMPYSALPALDDAWRVVRDCPVGNLSLLVDNWHLQRSGGPGQLGLVPAHAVTSVQLDDVIDQPLPDQVLESRYHRELPGRTAAQLLRQVWASGATPRLAVELMSGSWDDRPAAEVADATWAAAAACIDEAAAAAKGGTRP